jgi:outer membrane protein assembly factor BamB
MKKRNKFKTLLLGMLLVNFMACDEGLDSTKFSAHLMGSVLDDASEEPLVDILVEVGNQQTKTDGQGKFYFTRLEKGRQVISIEASHYEPYSSFIDLELGENQAGIIRLKLVPCNDRCLGEGYADCQNGQIRQCQKDQWDCLDWGPFGACDSGSCANNTQCTGCTENLCDPGDALCQDGAIRFCVADQQGCLNYGQSFNCPSGKCLDETQCADCQDSCQPGQSVCEEGMQSVCRQEGACYQMSGPELCALGCDGNTCKECSGESKCEDGVEYVCREGTGVYEVKRVCQSSCGDNGYCLDGTLAWSFSTREPFHKPIEGPDGTIYVGSDDNNIYALEGVEGKRKWVFATHFDAKYVVLSNDGQIVYGGNNKLYALSAEDGMEIWSFEPDDHSMLLRAPPVVGPDGTIHIVDWIGVYALDGENGTIKWHYRVLPPAVNAFHSLEVGEDGTVYTFVEDGEIIALDGDNGDQIWSQKALMYFFPKPNLKVSGGTLFVANFGIAALNATNGEIIWTYEPPLGTEFASKPYLGDNQTLYINSNKVFALDASNGALKWLSESVTHLDSSVQGGGGRLYVGAKDKGIIVLDAESGQQVDKLLDNFECIISDTITVGAQGNLYVGMNIGYVRFIYFNSDGGYQKWYYRNGGEVDSTPAIDKNGYLYFAGGSKVYKTDRFGTIDWEFWSDPKIRTLAIGPDDTLYVLMEDSVNAFDVSGNIRWMYKDNVSFEDLAIGPDGTLYLTMGFWEENSMRGLLALNGMNGEEKWFFPTNYGIYAKPAISLDGIIVVGTSKGILYGIDSILGSEVWEYSSGVSINTPCTIGSDGTVFGRSHIDSDNSWIFALDGRFGDEKWAVLLNGRTQGSVLIGYDNTLFVSTHNNLYAINQNNGELKWNIGSNDRGFFNRGTAIGDDNTLYILALDGIYFLDGKTGMEKWQVERVEVGDYPSSITLGEDGTVFYGSGRKINALHPWSSGLADTPWPKEGRDLQNTGYAGEFCETNCGEIGAIKCLDGQYQTCEQQEYWCRRWSEPLDCPQIGCADSITCNGW